MHRSTRVAVDSTSEDLLYPIDGETNTGHVRPISRLTNLRQPVSCHVRAQCKDVHMCSGGGFCRFDASPVGGGTHQGPGSALFVNQPFVPILAASWGRLQRAISVGRLADGVDQS